MKFSLTTLFALALSPCIVSASAIPSHNVDVPEAKLVARAETVQRFPSYAAASVASCKWVNQGKTKVVPKNLVLYVSRLPKSPANNKVVGLGIKTPAGSITPLVRIDMDDTNKAIHFNAVQFDNSAQKLAAVLTPTVSLNQGARTDLYLQYIKGIENRSAEFIWNWWCTGKAN